MKPPVISLIVNLNRRAGRRTDDWGRSPSEDMATIATLCSSTTGRKRFCLRSFKKMSRQIPRMETVTFG